ncbi:hypothetical protein V8F20_011089 [Naviculisporaceae sp. PSN 640]
MGSAQHIAHHFPGFSAVLHVHPTAFILISLLQLTLLLFTNSSAVLARTTMTLQGCYLSPGEDVAFNHRHVFQSIGYCMRTCASLNVYDDEADSQVIALTNATACFCGEPGAVPPTEDEVPMGECNLPCPGFAMETCEFA